MFMNNSLLLFNKKVVCMVGKVIKKLVKKKVFKLGLTGASLIGLMISSGFSFAKYIDTNYGNGNAGAARFNVTVSNNTKFIYLPDDLSSFSSGYYAFIADFTIDFTDCDVSTQYNLYLKICEEYSTDYDNPYDLKYTKTYFKLPTLSNDQTYTNYTIVGDVNDESHTFKGDNVPSYLTDNKHTVFDDNKLYYAFSNDGESYNWYPSFSSSVSNYEAIIRNINSNAHDKHYFKIVYFTYISINSRSDGNYGDVNYSATFGNSIILSKLEIGQVM